MSDFCQGCGQVPRGITHVCPPVTTYNVPVEDALEPLMVHRFSGDPWGRCTRCDHPAYHRIHGESSW